MKKNNQLFQSESIFGNIDLNFSGDPNFQFDLYASAYLDAGRTLANKLIEQNHYSDLDACPIIFLYRHALELSIKGFVIEGQNLFHVQGKAFPVDVETHSCHRLSKFTPALKVIFEEMKRNWDFGCDHLRNFEDYKKCISDVESIDLDSFAFRYPVTKKGKATVEKNFQINFLEFCNQVNPLVNVFFSSVYGIVETVRTYSEMYSSCEY